VLTSRAHLDRCLQRFVEHAIAGEDDKARTAFADAQAVLADVRAARDEAADWVAAEQRVAEQLPPGVEDLGVRQQLAAWGRVRGRGGDAGPEHRTHRSYLVKVKGCRSCRARGLARCETHWSCVSHAADVRAGRS
jgi:hypothetical protein